MCPSSPPAAPRLPNLVVVGVSRGGTTSLYKYLGRHRDIGTSDVKELRYFTPLRHGEPLAPLGTYAAHFSHCYQRYALEATPGYFYGGRLLARTLRETCPDVRTVVTLRAPSDRCWSWYKFVKSRTRIPQEMTFDAYLDRCEELHHRGVDGTLENQAFWGLGGGCYARWLDDWVDEMSDRLRVVFFDDVEADPQGTVAGLCTWLGLHADEVVDSGFAVNNKAEQYKHRRLQRAALAINRRGERFFHQHETTKRLLRSAYHSINRAPAEPVMSESARVRLDDFYRPYNARLAEQLWKLDLALPSGWRAPDRQH